MLLLDGMEEPVKWFLDASGLTLMRCLSSLLFSSLLFPSARMIGQQTMEQQQQQQQQQHNHHSFLVPIRRGDKHG
ncbi:hypothetical protein M0802_005389 [Mischocyttarus mexicanus]|nr:hypothetical protein M0802_005389 [Mischocyttarus mexicanus]